MATGTEKHKGIKEMANAISKLLHKLLTIGNEQLKGDKAKRKGTRGAFKQANPTPRYFRRYQRKTLITLAKTDIRNRRAKAMGRKVKAA